MNPNLLTGTRDFSGFKLLGLWNNRGYYDNCLVKGKSSTWDGMYKEITVVSGKWYTFSATVSAHKGDTIYIFITNNGNDKNGLDSCEASFKWQSEDSEPQRISMTFFCQNSRAIKPRVESGSSNLCTVCQYKLEEGKEATPWCPNVND